MRTDLTAPGHDDSYNPAAEFADESKAARQREQKTAGRVVFVPLAFLEDEAFRAD